MWKIMCFLYLEPRKHCITPNTQNNVFLATSYDPFNIFLIEPFIIPLDIKKIYLKTEKHLCVYLLLFLSIIWDTSGFFGFI